MSRTYLGFAGDLRRVLDKMRPLTTEYADDWKAAAAIVPTLDKKIRDQLATEHLVRCYRQATKSESTLPRQSRKASVDKVNLLLGELGVSSGEVKAWGVHQGLVTEIKRGRVGMDLVELYALAHEKEVARS